MDFLMPYASEVPEDIEIDHHETPSPLNPLGIKGAGEAGVIPGSALLASAVEDAEGIPIRSMPLTPSDLFHLRRQHGHTASTVGTPSTVDTPSTGRTASTVDTPSTETSPGP
jgi:carbon-monoxide dehydrogenase large subunit